MTVRLCSAGAEGGAMDELRAVLKAQIAPTAALLGGAAGVETTPAVCTFNVSGRDIEGK